MSDTVKFLRISFALCALGVLAACGEEPPPPTVDEFMQDPILLDATMVRCVAHRNSVSYDAECVNAREAIERLATAREKARRAALEAESERKREALRRAQEAADEVRRRAAEAEREREIAEYLGLVPAVPGGPAPDAGELPAIEPGGAEAAAAVTVQDVPVPPPAVGPAEPSEGGLESTPGVEPPAPGAETPAGAEPPAVTTDLAEIREQLEERQQTPPEPAH